MNYEHQDRYGYSQPDWQTQYPPYTESPTLPEGSGLSRLMRNGTVRVILSSVMGGALMGVYLFSGEEPKQEVVQVEVQTKAQKQQSEADSDCESGCTDADPWAGLNAGPGQGENSQSLPEFQDTEEPKKKPEDKADDEPKEEPEKPEPFEIVIFQSNEYVGLSPKEYIHDRKIMLTHEPDFITLNEMKRRSADLITPKGYDMWRGNDNEYMKGTPVLWREDTWKPAQEYEENRGTIMTSVAPNMKWATTAANWVTLEHKDGHIVSVISAHLPPFPHVGEDRRELYRDAVEKLNGLVEHLSSRGEVVLAGDMNTHFRIDTNPKKKGNQGKLHPLLIGIRKSGLISTYEPTTKGGESNEPIHGWGTGNNGGNGTIDYVFTLKDGALELEKQLIEERTLSDHDAVVATYTYRPESDE